MVKVLFYALIYLLTVYGALSLIFCVFNSIRYRVKGEDRGIKLVLLVKNQGRVIEGIVRNIFMGDFLRKIMSGGKLTVLDMGSEDETLEILERLKNDYGNLDILKESDKWKIFDSFDWTDGDERSKFPGR